MEIVVSSFVIFGIVMINVGIWRERRAIRRRERMFAKKDKLQAVVEPIIDRALKERLWRVENCKELGEFKVSGVEAESLNAFFCGDISHMLLGMELRIDG